MRMQSSTWLSIFHTTDSLARLCAIKFNGKRFEGWNLHFNKKNYTGLLCYAYFDCRLLVLLQYFEQLVIFMCVKPTPCHIWRRAKFGVSNLGLCNIENQIAFKHWIVTTCEMLPEKLTQHFEILWHICEICHFDLWTID